MQTNGICTSQVDNISEWMKAKISMLKSKSKTSNWFNECMWFKKQWFNIYDFIEKNDIDFKRVSSLFGNLVLYRAWVQTVIWINLSEFDWMKEE